MSTKQPRPRGRQPKPILKIEATPERAARAIFSAVEPPDPKRRSARRGRG